MEREDSVEAEEEGEVDLSSTILPPSGPANEPTPSVVVVKALD